MCYKNQMPCIRIKEVYQTTKHVIEGIELNCRVEELKKIAAEKTNIPVEDQSTVCIACLWFCFLKFKLYSVYQVYF